MVTHCSILAYIIPWPEEPGGPQSMWSQRAGHDERLSTHIHTKVFGAGQILTLDMPVHVDYALDVPVDGFTTRPYFSR